MALALFDRVQETTTTTGTGAVTLDGAVPGYQSFAVVGNTNTCYYTIVDGVAWEVGVGTYSTSGPTLARTTVLSNSNGNTSPITLAVGTKIVFLTYPAGKSVNLNESGNVSPLGTVVSGIWNGTTIGVAYGGTGVTASSGANSVVLRDANQNVAVNRVNQANTNTTAAGGTTALTAASSYIHTLVGTGGQTYSLPDATTLTTGVAFVFNNLATGTLTLANFAGTTIGTIPSGGAGAVFLTLNSTVGGTWDLHAYLPEGVTFGTNAFNLGTSIISGGTWQGGTIQTGYGGTGLTSYTSGGAVYANSSSTLTSGTLPVTAGGTGNTSGQAASTASSATFNSGGAGDASGTTFNGSAARTISYNTIGAPSTTGTNASGSWGISVTGTSSNITAYTINQNLGTGNQVTFDSVVTGNNGNGTNFRLGDDAWIGDVNIANTTRLQGVQSAASGYLIFGNGDNTALGRAGTGALTYGGNAVLTAANYNSYAPTLTGGGASGTWGINVTGTSGSIAGFNNPTTAATANTIAYRDSGGDIYQRYSFAVHFNQSSSNTENPSIAAFWTNSGADNYNRKSSPAHVISQLGLLTTSNYSSYALPLSGGTLTGNTQLYANDGGNSPRLIFGPEAGAPFSYKAIYTDAYWLTFQGHVNEGMRFRLVNGSTISTASTLTSSYLDHVSSLRAPIFYDSNDTSFYIDPGAVGPSATLASSIYVGAQSTDGVLWDYGVGGTYRPGMQIRGSYPHIDMVSVVANAAHGPTLRFMGYDNGSSGAYKHWVIGTAAQNLTFLDFGFASNQNNPHCGIAGYEGTTIIRATTSGNVGLGGDWGAFGSNGNPSFPLHVIGTGFATSDFRAPIFYDSNDTAYFLDPTATSGLAAISLRAGGLKMERAYTSNSIWFNAGEDTNHVLWNAYNGNNPITRGSSGFDGMLWNAYAGIQIRGGAAGAFNLITATPESGGGNINSHVVGLYAYNALQLATANGYSYAPNQFRAPIFYDSDDTAYYVTPNGASNIYDLIVRAGTPVSSVTGLTSGTAPIRVSNTGTGTGDVRYIPMISGTSTSSSGYLQHTVLGSVRGTVWGAAFIAVGGNDSYPTVAYTFHYEGYGVAPNSWRAPIFYDSDNTGYYFEGAGRSSLNQATFAGGLAYTGAFVLTGSGATLDNSTGARMTESYGPYWNLSNSATWHHQIINGSSLVGISAGGGNFGGGNILASGNITAYYSDERLKTKLTTIENALDKVKSLEGFIYVENDLAKSLGYTNDGEQAGVSAQRVKAVLPQAVSLAPVDMQGVPETGDIISKSGENYLTVDYSRLVPLLIEAIKELSAQVDELKKGS